jgi:hypothetical protein
MKKLNEESYSLHIGKKPLSLKMTQPHLGHIQNGVLANICATKGKCQTWMLY